MEAVRRPVALVTGGSRGIGAATVLALAGRGYDVVITYRNKAARAAKIADEVRQYGVHALCVGCDITQASDIERLFSELRHWKGRLDLLVLNAAGGLERDLVAADPKYPMRMNRDAQIALLDAALPFMPTGSTVIFVTSHWAHLYGQVDGIPDGYMPVAATKHAGEQALRSRQPVLAEGGIRLLVVTGDLIEGTIMSKLMERIVPGLTVEREQKVGHLPTVTEMGQAIAETAMDTTLPSGHTTVVGGSLDSFEFRQ